MTEPTATSDYPFLLAVYDALLDLPPIFGLGDRWYIYDVWTEVSKKRPWRGRSVAEFERWIVEQNRRGTVILTKADLPDLYDKSKLAVSAIRYGVARFELVNGDDARMAGALRELRHERELGAARARAGASQAPSARAAVRSARASAAGGPRYRIYLATVKQHNRERERALANDFGTIERKPAIAMPPDQWESLPKGSQDSELDWLRQPMKHWKVWSERHEQNQRMAAKLRAERLPEDPYDKELALMRARRR